MRSSAASSSAALTVSVGMRPSIASSRETVAWCSSARTEASASVVTVSVGTRRSSVSTFAASSSWWWRSRESSSIRSERAASAFAASGSVDDGELGLEPRLDRLEPGGVRLVQLVADSDELTGEIVDPRIGLRAASMPAPSRVRSSAERQVLAADELCEPALDRRDLLRQRRVRPRRDVLREQLQPFVDRAERRLEDALGRERGIEPARERLDLAAVRRDCRLLVQPRLEPLQSRVELGIARRPSRELGDGGPQLAEVVERAAQPVERALHLVERGSVGERLEPCRELVRTCRGRRRRRAAGRTARGRTATARRSSLRARDRPPAPPDAGGELDDRRLHPGEIHREARHAGLEHAERLLDAARHPLEALDERCDRRLEPLGAGDRRLDPLGELDQPAVERVLGVGSRTRCVSSATASWRRAAYWSSSWCRRLLRDGPRRRRRNGERRDRDLIRPLLRERARELEARDRAVLDEDLPERLPRRLLLLGGLRERFLADEAELEEDVTDPSAWPPLSLPSRRGRDGHDDMPRLGVRRAERPPQRAHRHQAAAGPTRELSACRTGTRALDQGTPRRGGSGRMLRRTREAEGHRRPTCSPT